MADQLKPANLLFPLFRSLRNDKLANLTVNCDVQWRTVYASSKLNFGLGHCLCEKRRIRERVKLSRHLSGLVRVRLQELDVFGVHLEMLAAFNHDFEVPL